MKLRVIVSCIFPLLDEWIHYLFVLYFFLFKTTSYKVTILLNIKDYIKYIKYNYFDCITYNYIIIYKHVLRI